MTRQNNAHRRALERIAQNPEKFGLYRVVSISIEPNLFHNGRGLIAQPDLMIESSKKEMHIIEYKSNGDKRLVERANRQLGNAVWWLGRYRPDILPENIHARIISGDDPEYRGLLR